MSQARVAALLVLIHVIWAGVNKAIEFGGSWLSPTLMAASRWTIVSFALFALFQVPAFRSATGAGWPVVADRVRAVVIGALLFGPCHAAYYWAISNPSSATTPAEGTVLLTSAPLWVAVMSMALLKERLGPMRWLAVGLGLIGAYMTVFGFSNPHLESTGSVGRVVFLSAVIVESLAFVLLVQIGRRSSGVGAFACQTVGAAIGLWILGALLPGAFPLAAGVFTPAALAGFLYITLVAGIVCFTIFMGLSEHQDLTFLSLAILLQPPLSALLDWMTGRAISPQTWVGTAIVSVALVVSVLDHRDRTAKSTA